MFECKKEEKIADTRIFFHYCDKITQFFRNVAQEKAKEFHSIHTIIAIHANFFYKVQTKMKLKIKIVK